MANSLKTEEFYLDLNINTLPRTRNMALSSLLVGLKVLSFVS